MYKIVRGEDGIRPNIAQSSHILPKKNKAQSSPAAITLAQFCVATALIFNFVFCYIDTNFLAISSAPIIAGEISIMGAALILVFQNQCPEARTWLSLLYGCGAWWLILCSVRQQIDPKILRDAIIIPVFVALGLTFSDFKIGRFLLAIQSVVFIFLIFELVFPDRFANIFNIMRFYIDTRGFDEASFWNQDSDLFVSATRPGDRFFPFFGAHRLSSIFLEPVSLGNYVIVITAALVGFHGLITRFQFWTLAILNVILLFGCDGRLAFGVCLSISLAVPFLVRYPVVGPVSIFPLAVFTGVLVTSLSDNNVGEDNLIGRLGVTFRSLGSLGIEDLFGGSVSQLAGSLDSGVTYLIIAETLPGAVVLWLFIFWRKFPNVHAFSFACGCSIYVSGTLLVSYSLFSIKTASLLWFLFGVGLGRGRTQRTRIREAGSPRPTA